MGKGKRCTQTTCMDGCAWLSPPPPPPPPPPPLPPLLLPEPCIELFVAPIPIALDGGARCSSPPGAAAEMWRMATPAAKR